MRAIWEKCGGFKWCVRIPFGGKKCLEAHACVRVLAKGPDLFLEIDLLGARERIPLANTCVGVDAGAFSAKACVSGLERDGKQIRFNISARLCIDTKIGPIKIKECVNLFSLGVHIALFARSELGRLGFDPYLVDVGQERSEEDYAFVELMVPEGEAGELDRMMRDKEPVA